MTIDEIIFVIKNRLKETGHVWTDEQVRAKASQIYEAGVQKMSLVGEAALNAEKHNVKNYSPSQYLKVLTGDFK